MAKSLGAFEDNSLKLGKFRFFELHSLELDEFNDEVRPFLEPFRAIVQEVTFDVVFSQQLLVALRQRLGAVQQHRVPA